MSFHVYVRGAAERDVASVQDWYEKQRSGLGAEFLDEFDRVLTLLAQSPFIYPVLYRDIRRAVLHRFPFLVWYQIEGNIVTVLACTHGKRNPATTRERLR
ncbi:MAG: type II toxin-antitoxin system RelE/ParE family toxin [Gammaproteobacteria bacterium]